ncbi:hypothetical protein ABBQ38_013152 [Trebouxia sp. C0009 RCD-2024]
MGFQTSGFGGDRNVVRRNNWETQLWQSAYALGNCIDGSQAPKCSLEGSGEHPLHPRGAPHPHNQFDFAGNRYRAPYRAPAGHAEKTADGVGLAKLQGADGRTWGFETLVPHQETAEYELQVGFAKLQNQVLRDILLLLVETAACISGTV